MYLPRRQHTWNIKKKYHQFAAPVTVSDFYQNDDDDNDDDDDDDNDDVQG